MTTDELSIDVTQPGGFCVASGKSIRLAMTYQNVPRLLMWVSVGKDGSVYADYSVRLKSLPRRIVPKVNPDGETVFPFDETEEIPNAALRPKMSLHASGACYTNAGRIDGADLRLLKERTHLCSFFPRHPSFWPELPQRRKYDLVLDQFLFDECPVSLDLYYQPEQDATYIPTMVEQGLASIRLKFENVEAHGAVVLHLIFTRQAEAQTWPPGWTVVMPLLPNGSESPAN